jgi:hypothetical protein
MVRNIPSKAKIKYFRHLVNSLFFKAKKNDPAEYICAIKYFLDMNNLHLKTPSKELADTIDQVLSSLPHIVDDKELCIKILSYVYCQIYESNNWLSLVYNLLLINDSECVQINPFKKSLVENKRVSTLEKVREILDESKSTSMVKVKLISHSINQVSNPNIGILTKLKKIKNLSERLNIKIGSYIWDLYNNDFRNDFTHSQYVIYKNELNLVKSVRHINLLSLIDLTVTVMNIYIHIMNRAFTEIERIKSKGSVKFKGKCGYVKVSFENDYIKHESKMNCANF